MIKVKVNTKGNYRHLNGYWLSVNEIVGTRVTCIIKSELSKETNVDFNLKEVVEMKTEVENKKPTPKIFNQDIRSEMDADMEESGMAQGEIESCLNHWGNKYVILRREWFSKDITS